MVAMIETDESDLDRVYGNLMAGSENHLRAFAGLIENLTGVPYEADPPTWGFDIRDVPLGIWVFRHSSFPKPLKLMRFSG